ncbi:MAG: protein translocase subunit SecD [Xanthomonadaceae bacterium]|nr:protein translocase subunit SecD [Xanthomonadaceae bacterium]
MNRYSAWKYILLILVLVLGGLYALPNLFGDDPAVQVSSTRGFELDPALQDLIEDTLAAEEIEPGVIDFAPERILVRLADSDQQLEAADVLRGELGDAYVVALNLAPATPNWLRAVNAEPMVLGLDLQGGVHFLMEVDMETAREQQLDRFVDDIRNLLRDERIRYRSVRTERDTLIAELRSPEDRQTAMQTIARELPELEIEAVDGSETFNLRGTISAETMTELQRTALQQNITTLRNRVNELGVAEPIIQQQGSDRIVVQLPGVQDTAEAKRILGATATLPKVDVALDAIGARRMFDFTNENVGNRMAVVFIEQRPETRVIDGEEVRETRRVEDVISVAVVREPFGRRFQTTGLGSAREASQLALLLRSGALAAPIEIIEERTVGPSLGRDNIDQGFNSVIIGFCLVLVLMVLYYRVFGLVADLALTVNLVLIVALLSMIGATLTLPGIAGIVLTVGMAVDANVLIFERIREELRLGNTPQSAIRAGYDKAFSTIADANVTTLIAALVLFMFGSGPVKGFAVTLSLGIVTSMFTAIFGTRGVINLIYGGRKRVAALSI